MDSEVLDNKNSVLFRKLIRVTDPDMNDNKSLIVFGRYHVTHVPPFYSRRQLHLPISG